MPTTIRTEAARVALAHREYEKDTREHRRQLRARAAVLMRDPSATDREAFAMLCAADPEFQELVLSLACDEVWRDSNIEAGAVATIEDDGSVRWTAREYAGHLLGDA
jgi:hypothetical protein